MHDLSSLPPLNFSGSDLAQLSSLDPGMAGFGGNGVGGVGVLQPELVDDLLFGSLPSSQSSSQSAATAQTAPSSFEQLCREAWTVASPFVRIFVHVLFLTHRFLSPTLAVLAKSLAVVLLLRTLSELRDKRRLGVTSATVAGRAPKQTLLGIPSKTAVRSRL